MPMADLHRSLNVHGTYDTFMGMDAGTLLEIEAIIKDVALNQFSEDAIESVTVEEGTDFDGDPVFNVTVVLKSTRGFDAHKASGFARHIRPRLMERDQYRFPLVRFMSKADADRLAAA